MAARTEAEVAADTVAALYAAAILPGTQRRVPVCNAVGITPAELEAAIQRLIKRSNRLLAPHREKPTYPNSSQAPTIDHKPPTRPSGKPNRLDPDQMTDEQIADQRERWMKNSARCKQDDNGGWLVRCTGIRIADAHWAPLEEFRDNSEFPWRKFSGCRTHTALYQSARHLKIDQLGTLERAGIRVGVAEDGPVFVCTVCREPIEEHQQMYVEGPVMHADCAPTEERP